jgi:hypothetical protein
MTILLVSFVITACTKSTCPPDTVGYIAPPYPTEEMNQISKSQKIQIGREEVRVDEVISGDVCNDSWSGTVYVTCDIQIPAWEEEELFFQDCELQIDEGTVVYVEAHGDQPYYQGCSCHE